MNQASIRRHCRRAATGLAGLTQAYGRFMARANAGHAASARQAPWMCEGYPVVGAREQRAGA